VSLGVILPVVRHFSTERAKLLVQSGGGSFRVSAVIPNAVTPAIYMIAAALIRGPHEKLQRVEATDCHFVGWRYPTVIRYIYRRYTNRSVIVIAPACQNVTEF
jgi:hypothetical protein